MGHVVEILIAESPSAAMKPQASVEAFPGKGLQGDRYFLGLGTFTPKSHQPDYELTLVEKEKIEAFAAQADRIFRPEDARRNIVTEGIDLNALVGKQFLIGEVLIRGVRLCEPCSFLARSTFPETLKGLIHKAGLRAQILTQGTLRIGDKIAVKS